MRKELFFDALAIFVFLIIFVAACYMLLFGNTVVYEPQISATSTEKEIQQLKDIASSTNARLDEIEKELSVY